MSVIPEPTVIYLYTAATPTRQAEEYVFKTRNGMTAAEKLRTWIFEYNTIEAQNDGYKTSFQTNTNLRGFVYLPKY